MAEPTKGHGGKGVLGAGIQETLAPIWHARKRIAAITGSVTVVTLLVNYLFLPVYYKATTTILPETEKGKLSALAQITDVASIAGVDIPGSQIARIYPIIANSEAILRPVILKNYQTRRFPEPVNLINYLDVGGEDPEVDMAAALKTMRGLLTVAYDSRTGVVTMSLEMREPQLAADVLNTLVRELDSFMRQKRISNATEQLKWLDVRIKEVEDELRVAEDTLKSFRERNRKVSDSPQLMLEQERLTRSVLVRSTIFVELKKQYELAKIEEIKNIAIVNVLDEARAPVKKERPKRVQNTLIFLFLAFLGSSSFYALDTMYGVQVRGLLNMLKSR